MGSTDEPKPLCAWAAYDWAPGRELGFPCLRLRRGQRVQLIWEQNEDWSWGRSADENDVEPKKEGWFPAYVLLGPEPSSTPPPLPATEAPGSSPSEPSTGRREEADDTSSSSAEWRLRLREPGVGGGPATSSQSSSSSQPGLSPKAWPARREEVASEAKLSVRVATLGLEAAGIAKTSYVETGALSYAEGLCGVNGPLEVDFWLDARCFWDPDAGSLKHHVGTHPVIIERLVGSDEFVPWLKSAKRHFRRIRHRLLSAAPDSRGGTPGAPALEGHGLTVLVFCRSGRHRAVAAATVLRHVVSTHEGVSCPEPLHLCLMKLGGCKCSYCRGWRGADVKDAALRKAADIWAQLP